MHQRNFQTVFFFGLLLGSLVVVYLLLRPFLAPLVFAATLAIMFWPVHRWMQPALGHPAIAAFISMVIVFSGVLIPLLVMAATAVQQARQLIGWLSQHGLLEQYLQQLVALPQAVMNRIRPGLILGALNVDQYLRQLGEFSLSHAGVVIQGVVGTLVALLIFLMALYYFFKEGEMLSRLFVRLSPLPDVYDKKIIHRVRTMVTSVIQGTILLNILQAFLAGVGFALFGVPGAVLWGMVTLLAAFIPWVGTALTLVPAIIYLIVQDQTTAALGLTIWGATIVGPADNIITAALIGRRAKINPLLVLLSVLGGLQLFGVIGALVGPIILSIFLALLEIYQADAKRGLLDPPAAPARRRRGAR